MDIRRTIFAAAAAVTAAVASASFGVAHADGLQPVTAQSIDLGELSGIAYYTVERAGYRIVATLGESESGNPVRFEAVLAPGQSIVLTTPSGVDAQLRSVEISRRGDEVLVRGAAAAETAAVVTN